MGVPGIEGRQAVKTNATVEESPWAQLSRVLDEVRGDLARGGKYFSDFEYTDKEKAEQRQGLNVLDRAFINTSGGPSSVEVGFSRLQNSYLQEPSIKHLKIYRDDGKQGWMSIKTAGDQLIASLEVSEDPATMKARTAAFIETLRTHVAERDAARARPVPAVWGQK